MNFIIIFSFKDALLLASSQEYNVANGEIEHTVTRADPWAGECPEVTVANRSVCLSLRT